MSLSVQSGNTGLGRWSCRERLEVGNNCLQSHHFAPGYSVAVLHRAYGFSYVAGAPRHKLRGAVFELLKKDTFVRQMEGEQVPLGEVTFPPVGALRSWEHRWAHPGQGSGLSVI